MTHCDVIDADGGDGSGVTAQLTHEAETTQVPDDARAVTTAAHDDVVAIGRRQTRDRLRVTVQRHLQVKVAPVPTLAVLPHVHHLHTFSASSHMTFWIRNSLDFRSHNMLYKLYLSLFFPI